MPHGTASPPQTHRMCTQISAGRATKGTLTAILGPSGGGKSSLLDCLALRTQNFTGALRLDGQPLTNDYFWQMGK